MPSPTRHVFVYGTLRRGESRDINKLQPQPGWVGAASVDGILFDLGSYPGMVLDGGEAQVTGEVYAITPELERRLDEIEEVLPQASGEYCKREVMVRLCLPADAAAQSLNGHLCLLCLLYEVAPDRTTSKPVITSGDWVLYRKQQLA